MQSLKTKNGTLEYRLGSGSRTVINSVEAKQQELDKKFDRLLSTIDSFVGRIDRYESEQLARDSQFNRLLDWARKVSEKTGIPQSNDDNRDKKTAPKGCLMKFVLYGKAQEQRYNLVAY